MSREYEVVSLRLKPIVVAYLGFGSVFLWLEIYHYWIRASWLWAVLGASVLASIATVAGWIAWRRERHLASLAALLLTAGILLSVVVPPLVGVLIYNLL